MMPPSLSSLKLPIFLVGLLLLALGQSHGVQAVKFKLQAERNPQPKCLWNAAHDNELVIITANVGSGAL
jgi:p24 family protein delta-1